MSDNIERALGRIEGKLEGMSDSLKLAKEEADKTMDNHGTRIGSLERWQARVLGISAAAIFIVGLALKFIK